MGVGWFAVEEEGETGVFGGVVCDLEAAVYFVEMSVWEVHVVWLLVTSYFEDQPKTASTCSCLPLPRARQATCCRLRKEPRRDSESPRAGQAVMSASLQWCERLQV